MMRKWGQWALKNPHRPRGGGGPLGPRGHLGSSGAGRPQEVSSLTQQGSAWGKVGWAGQGVGALSDSAPLTRRGESRGLSRTKGWRVNGTGKGQGPARPAAGGRGCRAGRRGGSRRQSRVRNQEGVKGRPSLSKERNEGRKAGGTWGRRVTASELAPGTHCRHSRESRSRPHSRGAEGASQAALWRGEAVGTESLEGLPPPPCPILPILSFSSGASTPCPGGSAFSLGCSSQGLSGLLLLGGGLGCFWRRMYSTGGEGGLSGGRQQGWEGSPGGSSVDPQGRGLDLDGEVGRWGGGASGGWTTGVLLTVLVVLPLYLVVVVQGGLLLLQLLLRLWEETQAHWQPLPAPGSPASPGGRSPTHQGGAPKGSLLRDRARDLGGPHLQHKPSAVDRGPGPC